LLKLGFAVAQSTVAKYMARSDSSPSGQPWGTFVRNHMPQIAAMDLFVVPTIGFNLLYVLSLFGWLGESWSGSMQRPTRRQTGSRSKITEAFPWKKAPR
jgi:hypothetical protein